jgi:hypothetical protein
LTSIEYGFRRNREGSLDWETRLRNAAELLSPVRIVQRYRRFRSETEDKQSGRLTVDASTSCFDLVVVIVCKTAEEEEDETEGPMIVTSGTILGTIRVEALR